MEGLPTKYQYIGCGRAGRSYEKSEGITRRLQNEHRNAQKRKTKQGREEKKKRREEGGHDLVVPS
jgi:hypothetical protein